MSLLSSDARKTKQVATTSGCPARFMGPSDPKASPNRSGRVAFRWNLRAVVVVSSTTAAGPTDPGVVSTQRTTGTPSDRLFAGPGSAMYSDVKIDRFRSWTVGPMATKRPSADDVSADEINDFVDGAAPADARRRIAEGLLRDPDANARMRFYRQQVKEMHRLYDGVLDEPMPDRLADLVRRARGTDAGG
jgi:hypothetical protein